MPRAAVAFAILGFLQVLPGALAADSSAGLLLVANKGDETLSIVDPAEERQVAAVNEDGKTGHEVAVSPDGKRAFVPIYGSAGVGQKGTDGQLIRVIDVGTRHRRNNRFRQGRAPPQAGVRAQERPALRDH
jgi:DNA-binding beta-propeller fold protein YncE